MPLKLTETCNCTLRVAISSPDLACSRPARTCRLGAEHCRPDNDAAGCSMIGRASRGASRLRRALEHYLAARQEGVSRSGPSSPAMEAAFGRGALLGPSSSRQGPIRSGAWLPLAAWRGRFTARRGYSTARRVQAAAAEPQEAHSSHAAHGMGGAAPQVPVRAPPLYASNVRPAAFLQAAAAAPPAVRASWAAARPVIATAPPTRLVPTILPLPAPAPAVAPGPPPPAHPPPALAAAPTLWLEGTVQKVQFRCANTAYSVLRVQVTTTPDLEAAATAAGAGTLFATKPRSGSRRTAAARRKAVGTGGSEDSQQQQQYRARKVAVNIVGNLPQVQVGQCLRFAGGWGEHKQYGWQFRATDLQVREAQRSAALRVCGWHSRSLAQLHRWQHQACCCFCRRISITLASVQ